MRAWLPVCYMGGTVGNIFRDIRYPGCILMVMAMTKVSPICDSLCVGQSLLERTLILSRRHNNLG